MSHVRHASLAALVALLLGAATALAAGEPGTGVVVAQAGAIEVTDADVRRLLAALPEANRAAVASDPASLEQLVRAELVRRQLLAELRAKGFDRDATAQADLERLRDDLLVRRWLERQAKPAAAYPTEEEVRGAYEAARQKAGATADYRLSQVFIAAPDGIAPDKLAAALRKASEVQGKLGGDFAALARSYSDQADQAAKGGEIGVLPEARLLPEVRAALVGARVGDVVGPIKTAQGLHFVKLLEKKPATVPALAEVHDALVGALRQQKAAELQQRYLADLAGKAPASVNQIALSRLRMAP